MALVATKKWVQGTLLVAAILVVANSWWSLQTSVYLGSLYVGGVVCILSARFAIRNFRGGLSLMRAFGRHLLVSLLAFPASILPMALAYTISERLGYHLFYGEAVMALMIFPLIVGATYGVVSVAVLFMARAPNRNVASSDSFSSRRGD
jgi:hypothetical protein